MDEGELESVSVRLYRVGDGVVCYLRFPDRMVAGYGLEVTDAVTDAFGAAFPGKRVEPGPQWGWLAPRKEELPWISTDG